MQLYIRAVTISNSCFALESSPSYTSRAEVLSPYGITPDSVAGRVRLSLLRKAGQIVPVSRTWCRVGPERRFELQQTSRDLALTRAVRQLVDEYCVWSLTALNPMLIHQRTRRLTLVEVGRNDQRMVFEQLRAERFRNVILETDTKWVVDHVGASDFDVVIRPLASKAPLEDKRRGIPSLEKIIVDLFIDGQILAGIAQSDLSHLIALAFSSYTIDIRMLRSYARRRRMWSRLLSYMEWLKVAPTEVLRDP